MKALLYKELRLAMHPICYMFILLFPLLILIPAYPLGVGFIYILACYPILFLGANKGRQSNDLLYSVLLPVRKKDIVLARILTVVMMQVAYMVLIVALYPLARLINDAMIQHSEPGKYAIPGLGLNSYVLLLAIGIIGYAVADLIFFPIYYKKGRSIAMSTLLTILGFVIYIGVFTILLPYIPGLEIMNNMHLGIQFAILGGAILLSILFHFVVYKVSSRRLEKVDF
ncbi:MAG: ABC-2 transporter permease [Bacilli bacterium]|nr:ABC-2 transporter permease [Bacilli bacterium]